MAGMASALPFGPNNLPQGGGQQGGGLGISEIALGGAGGSNVSQSSQNIGPNVSQTAVNGGFRPLVSTNGPVTSVPETGTSLLLLGVGLLALALWRRRWQRSLY